MIVLILEPYHFCFTSSDLAVFTLEDVIWGLKRMKTLFPRTFIEGVSLL